MKRRFSFLGEEFRKVRWASGASVARGAAVVVAFGAVTISCLAVLDYGLGRGAQFIFG